MHTPTRRPSAIRALHCALLVALSLPAQQALAQYKVVRPDGSVTYTDRPPTTENNVRITPLGRGNGGVSSPENTLPAELRQAAQRYPVVLYTAADCAPCDSGRRLLQQRGVPYIERRIASEEDAQALERLAGGRTVPALTVGAQQLRGLAESDWTVYLDAAGYPRESRLPRNWPTPTPTPLVERETPPAPPRAAAPPPPLPSTEPMSPNGVRF